MGVSRAYLDSRYLLAIIKEEDMAREVEHVLYNLRVNTFEVFVPHVVLGEVCGVIFRDFESDQDKRDKMARLVDMMVDNRIPWENMKPAEKNMFDILVDIIGRDKSLDTTDVMILSHVLSDPDSKFFFTTDGKMLRNASIVDLERSLHDQGIRNTTLKITDSF